MADGFVFRGPRSLFTTEDEEDLDRVKNSTIKAYNAFLSALFYYLLKQPPRTKIA